MYLHIEKYILLTLNETTDSGERVRTSFSRAFVFEELILIRSRLCRRKRVLSQTCTRDFDNFVRMADQRERSRMIKLHFFPVCPFSTVCASVAVNRKKGQFAVSTLKLDWL
jgi:hypothetical protein